MASTKIKIILALLYAGVIMSCSANSRTQPLTEDISIAESPNDPSAPTDDEDVPEWINGFPLPDTGCAAKRILLVKTRQSAILDNFLKNIAATDIRKLFPGQEFFEGSSYFLSVSNRDVEARAPFWDNFSVNQGKAVLDGAKYVTLTLGVTENIDWNAKYCFSYGNFLIFTGQWIDGLFESIELPIKTYVELQLVVDEPFYFWKCAYSDGKFDYQYFVCEDIELNQLGYDLTKKEYHKVVRKSADN